MTDRTVQELRNPTIISLGIHLFLFLIFLVITVVPDLEFPIPEEVEITFVVPVAPRGATLERQTTSVDRGPAEETVTLPERRMLEEEPPLLTVNQQGKISPGTEEYRPLPSVERADFPVARDVDKEPIGPEDAGFHEKEMPASDLSMRKDVPDFQLNWLTGKRTLLSQIKIDVPATLPDEATSVIQFEVLPDGKVGRKFLKQRENPVLDNAAMEAVGKAEFNALPEDSLRKDIAEIRFIYKLR